MFLYFMFVGLMFLLTIIVCVASFKAGTEHVLESLMLHGHYFNPANSSYYYLSHTEKVNENV